MEKEFTIYIPDDDNDISLDGKILVRLHEVKTSGRIWRFNLNDKDTFPSTPHGHDKENGDKVNVFTGEIYNKDRELVSKLSQKQLMRLKIMLKETHHAI